jgi:type I site-specific restriction-modification system R (restriction) subunit
MTSDDGNADATVEELAALAIDPQEDVAEVPATDEPIEPEDAEPIEPEEPDTDALSDADLATIDKFGKLDEADRTEKISKMLSSGRKDQVATAKVLMESFDLEVEGDTNTDEAVAESLRKLGLTPEAIVELRDQKETAEKKEAVKDWAEKLGLTQTAILKNKDFVKAFHQSDSSETQGKVDAAMKAYLKENPVSSSKKREATLKLSTTGKTTTTDAKPKDISLDELLDGKTLDEIAQSLG